MRQTQDKYNNNNNSVDNKLIPNSQRLCISFPF